MATGAEIFTSGRFTRTNPIGNIAATGSWILGIGSWNLEVGSCGEAALGVGTWKLGVAAKAAMSSRQTAWTPPSMDRSTLYVRDRKHVAAFDLQ